MILEEKMIGSDQDPPRYLNGIYASLLKEGKSVYVDAWGMSMYPFIKGGDRIKITPVSKEKEIRIGDIIAVDKKEIFLIHRVVSIDLSDQKTVFLTKGDWNISADAKPIGFDSVLGRVSKIHRRGLQIDVEYIFWRYFNSIIAGLSIRNPKFLRFISRGVGCLIEWRSLSNKIKNRIIKGDPVFSNTKELILLCLQKDIDDTVKAKAVNLIKYGIDWDYLYEHCVKYKLGVLLFHSLKEISRNVRIPKYILEKFKAYYLLMLKKTILQHKELIEVLRLFQNAGIDIVPLKGIVLSNRLYDDITVRALSVDFDFLVKPIDKNRAKQVLLNAGYKLKKFEPVKEWQWNYTLGREESTEIHLHWDITMMGRNPNVINGLWKCVYRVEQNGVSFLQFNDQALLFYLSVHLVNSGEFDKLIYLYDISKVIEKYRDSISWKGILTMAYEWKLNNILYLVLSLTNQLFNTNVDEGVFLRLESNPFKYIIMRFFINRDVILRGGIRKKIMDKFLRYILFELIQACSFAQYLAVLSRVFAPPKEVMGNRNYILRSFRGLVNIFK